MQIIIFLFAFFSYSFALSLIDWTKVQPKNARVPPLSNFSIPVSPKVVGGREAQPNSRPYQAAVIIDGSYFCGGSLISNRFVLTAAHCIEGHAYFQVILGAHNIRELEPTQIVITSTNIIVHPNYNPSNLNNDIGLIRFPSQIVFNDNIQSVSLPPVSSGSFESYIGILTGWGRLTDASNGLVSTLHEVDLTVISNSLCNLIFGVEYVGDFTLCTSGAAAVGACDGDSGSPLVVNDIQVGVVSFVASSGCQAGYPTAFSRITTFRSWIIENSDL